MPLVAKFSQLLVSCSNRLPDSLLLLLARLALAAVFWLSAQTKIDGFAFNPFAGEFQFGWPQIKDTTFFLFEYEYALPLLPPALAAYLATIAEHLFAIMLLVGAGTRLAALGVVTMTLVIQLFVYPDAYGTHATWIALGLWLMKNGAGAVSLEAMLGSNSRASDK